MMTQAPRLTARGAVIAGSVVVLALLCAASPVRAQQVARLVGSIYDQTGGTLAGATVTVTGAENREGHTSAAGQFEFEIGRAHV